MENKSYFILQRVAFFLLKIIMFTYKKLFWLSFFVLLSVQNFYAQSGWSVNKLKVSGDLVTVYFTSVDNGWVAGDKGYLAFTTNGGRNWIPQSLKTDENINEIYFRNDNNGYLVAGKKNVHYARRRAKLAGNADLQTGGF